ncbi:MAG: hypothetical protein JWR09_1820, partial [Mucilaginibacter sp.]|nr:hypothetical protein [Mucilaginibacter sp.]
LRGTKQSRILQSKQEGVELALAVVYSVRLPRCARNDNFIYALHFAFGFYEILFI